jgi:tRNA 2-thiouridine synthesizing protein A
MSEELQPAGSWDAGELGCGELVFELMTKLRALAPGAIFRLTARDAGAPHDIPAWCRLTGNALVRAEPPHYLIRRKG